MHNLYINVFIHEWYICVQWSWYVTLSEATYKQQFPVDISELLMCMWPTLDGMLVLWLRI